MNVVGRFSVVYSSRFFNFVANFSFFVVVICFGGGGGRYNELGWKSFYFCIVKARYQYQARCSAEDFMIQSLIRREKKQARVMFISSGTSTQLFFFMEVYIKPILR